MPLRLTRTASYCPTRRPVRSSDASGVPFAFVVVAEASRARARAHCFTASHQVVPPQSRERAFRGCALSAVKGYDAWWHAQRIARGIAASFEAGGGRILGSRGSSVRYHRHGVACRECSLRLVSCEKRGTGRVIHNLRHRHNEPRRLLIGGNGVAHMSLLKAPPSTSHSPRRVPGPCPCRVSWAWTKAYIGRNALRDRRAVAAEATAWG